MTIDGQRPLKSRWLAKFGVLTMHQLAAALALVVIPATVLATLFRWLDIEFALGIVWVVLLLLVAIGLAIALGVLRETPAR